MRFSPSTLGWYPEFINYPNLPADIVTVPDALHKSLMGKQIEVGPDGFPRAFTAPPSDPVAPLISSLQSLLDSAARERGYDDIKTAITYRGDPNPKFAAEAEAFFLWRSDVWTRAYAILEEVQNGERALPTEAEALELMPALVH